jgi:hypothetical protein
MKRGRLIFPILIFSLVINLYGIKWGLPSKDFPHPSFHPDETASLESSMSILDPNRTLYPSPTALGNGAMQFYLVAILYKIGQTFGFLKANPTNYADLTGYYFTGRILTLAMSILMIYFIFLVTKIIFGVNIALLASMFLASMPGLVTDSHYFRPEAPAAFWLVLTLFFAVKIIQTKQTKFYLLAAMSAGFAASTKYNSAFAVILIIAAHIITLPKKNRNFKNYLFDKRLIYSYLIVVLAFLAGSIGILFYFSEFKERLLKQIAYQKAAFLESTGLGPSWIGYLTQILPYSLTLPMLILSIIGIIWGFIKRLRWDILLLLWTIAYYILMTRTNWWVVRYTVPLLPPLAILAAHFIFDFPKRKFLKTLFLVIGLAVFAVSSIYSLMLDSILAAKDPRILTREWVSQNVPAGKKIGIDLSPAAIYVPADENKYQIVSLRLDGSKLSELDYYIANDQIYQHYLRLPNVFPYESHYFQKIFSSGTFNKVVEFENPLKLFGWKFPKAHPPHDYLYFQPKFTVYQRVVPDTLK